jgi:hypothetical protein
MSSFSRRDVYDHVYDISDDEEDYPQEEPFYFDNKYLYDYYWYHENFPLDWAICPKEGTGPSQCGNCLDYGCINGIFIGYCANCAIYDYEGSRGRGFIDVGVESDDTISMGFQSVFDTYLKDVDIHAIVGVDNTMPDDYQIDNPAPETGNNDQIDQSDFSEDDIYGENFNDIREHSGIECHFEGGYNDM